MGYFARLGGALFGRREVKASQLGAMVARVLVGMPVWPERDFEKLGREAYRQNPIVARAVNLTAEAVTSITMELHKGRGKALKTIDEHPLLALLADPNPEQDGAAFLQSVVSHLMISGNAFIERTNEDRVERMELYCHRPDRVKVIPGRDGFPEAYEFRAGGDIRRVEVDIDKRGRRPILHVRRFNPVNDWYGMSPLDPAAWSIDTHNAAGAWNKALLENSATPSGAFVYTGNPNGGNRMPDDMYAELKAQISEDRSGPRNAGRPLILEGGMDWKSMSVDPDKMQFVESKNMAAREIALALGVPPMLLGIPGDNTYANYAEANRAFYRQSVIPLAKWIARALTSWFGPMLEDGMRLEVDLDSIDALRSERMELWAQLDKTTFLTINEKREQLHWKPVEGGDEIYTQASLIPIGAPDNGAIAGGPEPPPEPRGSGKPPAGSGRSMAGSSLN